MIARPPKKEKLLNSKDIFVVLLQFSLPRDKNNHNIIPAKKKKEKQRNEQPQDLTRHETEKEKAKVPALREPFLTINTDVIYQYEGSL